MNIKLGLYICAGCQIKECLDIEALADIAKNEYSIGICKKHPAFCSESGLDLINKDIEKEKLEGVIIAACSPRHFVRKFSFPKKVITARINLREQVVWCSVPNNEDTRMLAEDYIRMGIVKILNTNMQQPYIIDKVTAGILVIGGGITGITAAIDGAKAGYDILLVEKEKDLGGWSKKLYKQLPARYPYRNSEDPVITKKINELKDFSGIRVMTSSKIKEISGQPGGFEVKINNGKNDYHFYVASIIAALGWHPYNANKLTEYGYSKYKDVITNVELEEMAGSGSIFKPSDKKIADSILFIQCAGSRSNEHLPYCSSYCCGTSLKQAEYIRNSNRNASVFIIYKDIRTPGHYENFYREIQKDEHVFMTKGEVKNVSKKNGKLNVLVDNTIIGEKVNIPVDLIVLATGMIPADSEELNLKYRQGKGLPEIKYKFPDSHFICFPYETRRTGIYAAGSFRVPMDITGCTEDATGATLKAIQCLESAKRGEAVHPRSGDRSYPDLYLDRCTDCKRCTEECPFGAYDENEKGTPLLNINRCRRCAICLGSCPERVINFSDYSINIISEIIKSVYIPVQPEDKPRILTFVCENDAYPAIDMAGLHRMRFSAFVRIIPVRCMGSINTVWIYDALARGFDGILQIGCKPGDNYQCHFMTGSELTENRAKNLRETLSKMMLEPERVRTEFVEIDDYYKIPEIINNYVKIIKKAGPNPFKDL
ncbi:MAG: FAD-dependent oxidoreductase [Bacteroidales bacterium]|nr:MAG: FAD-dependent oxidoreductase [Bacteroidales bacterium]